MNILNSIYDFNEIRMSLNKSPKTRCFRRRKDSVVIRSHNMSSVNDTIVDECILCSLSHKHMKINLTY